METVMSNEAVAVLSPGSGYIPEPGFKSAMARQDKQSWQGVGF
jgi:hypothetical protein